MSSKFGADRREVMMGAATSAALLAMGHSGLAAEDVLSLRKTIDDIRRP